MKWVPFPVISAAKEYDAEAIEFICRHFERYIVYRSVRKYSDLYGNEKSFLDDERYSEAQTASCPPFSRLTLGSPPRIITPVEFSSGRSMPHTAAHSCGLKIA